LISSEHPRNSAIVPCARELLLGLALFVGYALTPSVLAGQQSVGLAPSQSSGPTAQSFQGSVTQGDATGQNLDLSLDDAIAWGLKNNLGVVLSSTQTQAARGQRLS